MKFIALLALLSACSGPYLAVRCPSQGALLLGDARGTYCWGFCDSRNQDFKFHPNDGTCWCEPRGWTSRYITIVTDDSTVFE